MWYFTISCIAGFLACFSSGDVTNTYMYGETKAECLHKAEAAAAMLRLPAGKWEIRCEQTDIVKRKADD